MSARRSAIVLSLLAAFAVGYFTPAPKADAYGRQVFLGCKAKQNGSEQTTLTSSFGPITFSANDYDTSGGLIHSTSSNKTKLFAQWSGTYFAWGQVSLAAGGGDLQAGIKLNGTTLYGQTSANSTITALYLNCFTFLHMAAGDYVELVALATGATGSTKTAADSFTHAGLALVASDGGVGRSSNAPAIGCRAYLGADQAVSSSTWSVINYGSEDWKSSSGVHSTSSNKSRLIAPFNGYYLHIGTVSLSSNTTGERQMGFAKNTGGSTSLPTLFNRTNGVNFGTGGDTVALSVAGVEHLVAGDYFECYLFLGAAVNAQATYTGGTMLFLGEAP